MSEPATPARPFYVAGGTLKAGEPSYVERRADTELFESLLAGEFCYVLTARQMGKSSLMARTAKRLEQAGVASAIVDLTQIGSERGDQAAAQWYFGIANLIHRQLKITDPLRLWWQERADLPPVQRLTDFFREFVLANVPGRAVVFVDEIDSTVGLPFADDFFAALRACFNARAIDEAFDRLTFVLLGVATPDQLIRDQTRTPFNIGKRIDLTDFGPDEAQVLAAGLHLVSDEAGERLERILHWTGGHPYLTQAVCRAVREKGGSGTAEEAVDPQVEELFLSSRAQREETNLKHARARLEQPGPEGRRLLRLYRRVRQGKPVPDQPTSPLFAQLKLAGVVKATDDGRLAVRNRIYERVFTAEWAGAAMPADRGRQLAAATLAASLIGLLVWYAAFQPRPYEEAFQAAIKDDGYNSALEAYTALRANPFSRSRATELMQEFWEQRALRYALAGQRDESLVCFLRRLEFKDSEGIRRQVGNLVGPDYKRLLFTLRHAHNVTAVTFSSDGRTVLTGSSDSTARLWDARSGKPIASPFQHEGPVGAMALSPDGQTLATGSRNNTSRIWDIRSGRLLAPPLQHQSPILTQTFSPDGRILATGSWDRTAHLWDSRSGKLLGQPLQHQAPVFAVAFSPDGRSLVTISRDYMISLWEISSGKLLAPPFRHSRTLSTPAYSPDGHMLAVGGWDNAVRLLDTRSKKAIPIFFEHQEPVFAVAFSSDGQTLATGSWDNTARLWGTYSGKPFAPPLQQQGAVVAVAFSPNNRILVTGSRDNTARLWDAHPESPIAQLLLHKDFILGAAFSPDGRTLATGSRDGTARLWDTHSGKPIVPPLTHEGFVYAVAFSPDGGILATGSEDSTARIWDVHTGKPLTPPLQHQASVLSVAFSPDGRMLATASEDRYARLWDARTGKLLEHSPLQGQSIPRTIAFSPNGEYFFVATDHWLNTFSWDGENAVHQSSRLLHGFWKKGFRFPSDCESCLQVALGDTGNSFHLETLRLDGPTDPPIEGDPQELLEKWQARLGLKFDEQMKPVPR